jgi:hypothetical protein
VKPTSRGFRRFFETSPVGGKGGSFRVAAPDRRGDITTALKQVMSMAEKTNLLLLLRRLTAKEMQEMKACGVHPLSERGRAILSHP